MPTPTIKTIISIPIKRVAIGFLVRFYRTIIGIAKWNPINDKKKINE
jgi:hypothetical protein